MPRDIDLGVILRNEEYIPEPGFRYEISEGRWGVMKRPTAALMEEVTKLATEPDATDFSIAKIVLTGLPPNLEEKDCVFGMPSAVAADFFTMLRLIGGKLIALSQASAQSEQENDPPE